MYCKLLNELYDSYIKTQGHQTSHLQALAHLCV